MYLPGLVGFHATARLSLPKITTRPVTSFTQSHPNAIIEPWLRKEVLPAYDAMKADPGSGLSARSVFAEARARYTKHKTRGEAQ